MDHYLLFVWGDVEPEIHGPYANEEERDRDAIKFKYEEGDAHGIYAVNVDWSQHYVGVDPYSGGFFDDGLEKYYGDEE